MLFGVVLLVQARLVRLMSDGKKRKKEGRDEKARVPRLMEAPTKGQENKKGEVGRGGKQGTHNTHSPEQKKIVRFWSFGGTHI